MNEIVASKPKLKRGAVKAFREYLNRAYAQHTAQEHNRFTQISRPYGDHLYAHDRDKFDYELGMAMQGLSAGFDHTRWVQHVQ
jgi:hypothetical protein